jgi:hypothetical protein
MNFSLIQDTKDTYTLKAHDAYQIKDDLKAIGWKYDGMDKCWYQSIVDLATKNAALTVTARYVKQMDVYLMSGKTAVMDITNFKEAAK